MSSLSIYSATFANPAGIAHGSVNWEKPSAIAPGGSLRASLAFETLRNPALLESPTYCATFAPTEKGKAVRALKSAARRRGLKLATVRNA